MAAPMFFFDANVSSPQELAKKRAVAQAMMMNFGKARNVGEGAGQLLQGIALGLQNRKWNQAEAAGKASAGSLFSNLFSGGQGAFPPAPPPPSGGSTVEPMDPASRRVSQAFGDNDIKAGIVQTASALGIDPVDLATAISYETAGTFDPTKRGPTTQWGQHRGLIQFGEPQAKKYGVDWSNPVGSQLGPDGAVAKYLRDTGVKPGMGMLDIYSAINAGGVGRYGASDANNGGAPGTVADKVNNQMSSHRRKAEMLLADMMSGGQGAPAGQPMPQGQEPLAASAIGQLPVSMAGGTSMPVQKPPAQMAQAQGTLPEMAGNAPSVPRQQAGGPSIEVLMQAMSNPWLDDGQKQVIGAMLEQKLREQDPMRALEMQKAQIELQRLQNPGPEYDMITGRDGSIFRADKRTGNIEQVYGGKPDQPSGVQEYEYYANQERAAGREPAPFGEWKATQSRAGASQVNIDQKTEGAFDKKLAEGQAEIFNTMAQEGLNANADIAIIGQLDGLLGQNGGTLSGLSSMMAKYGIGGEGMSDIQAAQALINKLVPSQRQPGSGTMSDRDVELFTRSLPSLWNTPGGNKIILDTMRGLAEYKRKQGEIAMGVQMGELTRQEAVQALKALPNPLAGFGTNDRPQKKQPTVIDGYTIEEVD